MSDRPVREIPGEDFWADWRKNPVGNALALAVMVTYVALVVVPICVLTIGGAL